MRESEQLRVEYLPVERLVPYARNARTHSEAQVAQLAGSIREFGFTNPVLVDEQGGIIAGHGRVLAARKLQMAEVPTITLHGLTEVQRRAYVIADNKLALNAGWDDELLALELQSFATDGYDLELTGFVQDELDALLKAVSAGDGEARDIVEDEAPEPPKDPVTKPGDLWLLGQHRLLCGDSTKAASWATVLMDGERLDMVFTDPPYGVDYVGKTKDALTIENDGAEGLPAILAEAFDALVQATKGGAVWYVCAPPGPINHHFGRLLQERGIYRQGLVWAKQVFVLGHSDFHYQHEPIFYGWTPGAPHRAPPDRKRSTLWSFDRPMRSKEHPTMKPVTLVAYAVECSSAVGEIVGDGFGGSGTTLIAAEQSDRVCRTIELSPAYCDVIIERWEKLTGQKAKRALG